jgi:hypothetical protein
MAFGPCTELLGHCNSKAQNEFPVQENQYPKTLGPPQQEGGMRASKHLS